MSNRPGNGLGRKLFCERLEDRLNPNGPTPTPVPDPNPVPVPEVVTYYVNTEFDTPDANLADNIPQDAQGWTSLRSVIQQVNALGVNAGKLHDIQFANVHGQPFLSKSSAVNPGGVIAPGPTTLMSIQLESQLPTLPVNRDYSISGSTTRRVIITRDASVPLMTWFRFLDVGQGGYLQVNGVKFEGANNRGVGNQGGAIHNAADGELIVVNCRFENNIAEQGGAIQNRGALWVGGGSEFVGNTSQGFGGAIHTGGIAPALATATIQNTQFEDNVAGGDNAQREGTHKGGAIATNVGGHLNIASCGFFSNLAREGGAIYADGMELANPSLVVTGSTFDDNRVQGPVGLGGAVYIGGLNARFTGCDFLNNVAESNTSEGGAILQQQGKLVLNTCTFVGNSAGGLKMSHHVANVVPLNAPLSVFLEDTTVLVVRL